jgi:hypothetical protein
MVGPTVTIETTAAVDALITTQALVDYQYTVSSSVNPAFVPSRESVNNIWGVSVSAAADGRSSVGHYHALHAHGEAQWG